MSCLILSTLLRSQVADLLTASVQGCEEQEGLTPTGIDSELRTSWKVIYTFLSPWAVFQRHQVGGLMESQGP